MAQITSRPIRVHRLEPFALCALSIHNGCDKRLMRILKPQVYYLNDWIIVEGHESDETARLNPKRLLDADWYGKYINVQAIVGKNGSGKSSLLDMVYRIVNNFGVALTCREHELSGSNKDAADNVTIVKFDDDDNIYPAFVSGIDARLYFVNGDKIGYIHCCKEKVSWNYNSSKVDDISTVGSEIELRNIADDFCYTIGVNYAAQAYLPSDYRFEPIDWYLDDGKKVKLDHWQDWIQGVFHKNDGYHLPICLNPFRSYGSLDMVREMNLTYSRLAALFQLIPIGIKIIDGYHLYGMNSKYRPDHVYDAYLKADKKWFEWNRRNSLSALSFTEGKNDYSANSGIYKPSWKSKEEFLADFKKIVLAEKETWARHIIETYNQPIDGNLPDSTWWMYAYLVKKTLSIAGTYPSFKNFRQVGQIYFYQIEFDEKDPNKDVLTRLIRQIRIEDSHITLKIEQTLNYLKKHRNEDIDENFKLSQIIDVEKLDLNENVEIPSLSDLNEMQKTLLPPIFKTEIAFQRDNAKEKDSDIVLLGNMSSGERQQIFTFTTIVYHVLNLLSIKYADRNQYRNVTVVFDELEICFHPEFQRGLISNLITFIEGLGLNNAFSFNIILATHSPFVLSDLPESCRLMLKDGVPQDEKEKTFGANVYDLLNNHFFMTEFVGKFAAKKIDDIIEKINNALENNDTQNIEKLQSEINIIGDDFIRYKLNERIEPLLSNHKKALLKAELAQKEEELNILKQRLEEYDSDKI